MPGVGGSRMRLPDGSQQTFTPSAGLLHLLARVRVSRPMFMLNGRRARCLEDSWLTEAQLRGKGQNGVYLFCMVGKQVLSLPEWSTKQAKNEAITTWADASFHSFL